MHLNQVSSLHRHPSFFVLNDTPTKGTLDCANSALTTETILQLVECPHDCCRIPLAATSMEKHRSLPGYHTKCSQLCSAWKYLPDPKPDLNSDQSFAQAKLLEGKLVRPHSRALGLNGKFEMIITSRCSVRIPVEGIVTYSTQSSIIPGLKTKPSGTPTLRIRTCTLIVVQHARSLRDLYSCCRRQGGHPMLWQAAMTILRREMHYASSLCFLGTQTGFPLHVGTVEI